MSWCRWRACFDQGQAGGGAELAIPFPGDGNRGRRHAGMKKPSQFQGGAELGWVGGSQDREAMSRSHFS